MIKYKRLTFIEREEISRRIASGESLRRIATNLQRAPSSISREIHQSEVIEREYYRALYAQQHSNADEFRHLPKGLKRTLTYDQGIEMAKHKLFTKETDITVYFAHPHAPWERGTNENTNTLLRQYFPKNTDFAKISKERLKEIQDELNDRPRETLGWYTPHEKFAELLR